MSIVRVKSMMVLAGAMTLGMTLTQTASAADLHYKAPPAPVVAPFSWTGFYIGVNGGGGFGTAEGNADIGATLAGFGIPGVAFTLPLASHNINGFLAGGQIGYNYQVGRMVYGIEGDFDWADLEGNTACVLSLFNCNTKVNWTADITGRVGFVPLDRLMIYVKGGVSWADVDSSFGNSISIAGFGGGITGSVNASSSTTRVGGLLGMGVEYAFLDNWSAKLEYDYADYGTDTDNYAVTASGAIGQVGGAVTFNVPVETKLQVHVVKFGLNYRF